MDNILENKSMRFFIIIYAILCIAALVYIWWPKSASIPDFAYYTEYTDEDVAEKMGDYYTNNIFLQLLLNQEENISNNLSQDYLDYSGLTNKDIINNLKKLNMFNNKDVKTENLVINTNDNEHIYSFDVNNGLNKLRLNIIESKPYQYKISFENIITNSNLNFNYLENGISIAVEKVIKTLENVEYHLLITNVDNEMAEVNLATYTDAYLNFTGNTKVGLLNPIKYDNEILKKGSSIRKVIKFQVPFNAQSTIDSITFSNIITNGLETKIEIDI